MYVSTQRRQKESQKSLRGRALSIDCRAFATARHLQDAGQVLLSASQATMWQLSKWGTLRPCTRVTCSVYDWLRHPHTLGIVLVLTVTSRQPPATLLATSNILEPCILNARTLEPFFPGSAPNYGNVRPACRTLLETHVNGSAVLLQVPRALPAFRSFQSFKDFPTIQG